MNIKATVMPIVIIGLAVVGCFTIGVWWTAGLFVLAAMLFN